MKKFTLTVTIVLWLMSLAGQGLSWNDNTHLAAAKAANYERWYNAAGADMAKLKAYDREAYNHYYRNNNEAEITPQIVLAQVERYNKMDSSDAEGHLYGAIIASLQDYKKSFLPGKYKEYHLAYCAHYIGDLSMPFHNIPNDIFNKSRHYINDGIGEKTVLNEPQKIVKHMYHITLRDNQFEADLAAEIARIANLSRQLGYKLRTVKRNMTQDEVYEQLGHSASLLKAVLQHYKKL